MKFDKVCPKINAECIGDKCAAFGETPFEEDLIDQVHKKTINGKEHRKYVVVDYHVFEKRTTIDYWCEEYKGLRKQKIEHEKVDAHRTRHENLGKYGAFHFRYNETVVPEATLIESEVSLVS